MLKIRSDNNKDIYSEGARGIIERVMAFVCGLCLIIIILLTATQAVCYWIPDWWRNEYAKYDTPSNVRGEMSLDDTVHITEDMLEYCMGRLDTLDDTEATIDGITSPFFTDREKQHLSDCRELFGRALRARIIAALLLTAFLLYLYVHSGMRNMLVMAARGYIRSLTAVILCAVMVLLIALHDFTYIFTVFHHIFFDNDLWILYPDKDNLINIMQEDVFADAAIWIGSISLAICALLAVLSIAIMRKRESEEI